MTKWILLATLMLSPLAHAKEGKSSADGESTASASGPMRFSVNFHGGLMLDSADPEVRSKWTHDPVYSYTTQLGFYYNLPLLMPGFYLFAGPDIAYSVDEEENSSNQASSYLTSKYFQILGTLGAGWQPAGFYNLGFTLFASYEIWGQKETDFDGHGMSKDLGTENSDMDLSLGLTVYYAITPQWKPFIGYKRTVANSLIGGGDLCVLRSRTPPRLRHC